jgi:para-aminobenzoate synthetase component 1
LAVAQHLDRRDADGLIFFDSGTAPEAGDWSILSCAPTRVLMGKGAEFLERGTDTAVDPVAWLLEQEAAPALEADESSLPFSGGLAGCLGFEFCHRLDSIHARPNTGDTPDVWVGVYPWAALFEHATGHWHLVGDRGEGLRLLEQAVEDATYVGDAPTSRQTVNATVDEPTYVERARRSIEAIYAGEVFEINYSERFEAPWSEGGFALYRRLRQTSSARYGGYMNTSDIQICSASPEQFIQVNDGHVLTRPIKGTRSRGATDAEDARLAEELLASEKDRAENIMIVDLMRNDLTRVCALGTVEATALCELETYNGVHHLVSTVEGELDPSLTPMTALLSAFPAGSITGAPKLRAIELITALEQTPRGPYTGSMFYASRHGRLDSNVLIRTATLSRGLARYGAGGAVVAQSDPADEYDEALVKAQPFFQAVQG